MQAQVRASPPAPAADETEPDLLHAGGIAIGLLLDRLALARLSAGNDLAALLVLAAVVEGNAEGFADDPAVVEQWSAAEAPAPDQHRCPVSGYSVALRLGLSRETVRRKLMMLRRQGLVEWVNDGYVVPAAAIVTPAFQDSARRNFRLAVDHFQALEAMGWVDAPLSSLARQGRAKPRAAGRAVNSYAIDVVEAMSRLGRGELKETLLFCAAFRHAVPAPYPAGAASFHRGPTTVALATELGLSRETARRHVRALEAAGLVVDGAQGVKPSAEALQSARLHGALRRAVEGRGAFLRRLAEANVLGEA